MKTGHAISEALRFVGFMKISSFAQKTIYHEEHREITHCVALCNGDVTGAISS